MNTRTLLKEVRRFPPMNWALTQSVRAVLRSTGRQQENLVRHLPRSGRVSSRLPNGRWARFGSRGDDGVANEVFWREWHGYEPEQTLLFHELARRSRVTLDIGAHIGFYTVLAALTNPAGHVYALEPLPKAFERLQENITLNGLTNVHALCMAAADRDTEAEFFHVVTEDIPSSSSLSREFMEDIGGSLQSTSVRTARLDTLMAEANIASCVDLVKIDTETTELEVLGGMAEVLSQNHPAIFCEVLPNGDGAAITRLLQPLGYQFFLLTAAGMEERPAVEPVERWRNWLFVCGDPITLITSSRGAAVKQGAQ